MPLIKNFDAKALLNKIRVNQEMGKYAAESWRKHIEPYVPYNTGRLCNDVTIRPYKIIYNAPYADKVYNDLRRNFRKDKHPLATARWSEVAAPAVRDYFIQDMQDFVDGINFNA